jgi:hypothetical protein
MKPVVAVLFLALSALRHGHGKMPDPPTQASVDAMKAERGAEATYKHYAVARERKSPFQGAKLKHVGVRVGSPSAPTRSGTAPCTPRLGTTWAATLRLPRRFLALPRACW